MRVYFDKLKESQRITRVIIGMPSSHDITSEIDPNEDWGAIDSIDRKKITFEDVDEGVVYFSDEPRSFYKVKTLKGLGFAGLEIDSLHDIITTDNLF